MHEVITMMLTIYVSMCVACFCVCGWFGRWNELRLFQQ